MNQKKNVDGSEEFLISLKPEILDERGVIRPILDHPINSVALVESKKNALRANHFHKTDWHYCYVISGCINYYYRPTGTTSTPKMMQIKVGQMIFTPPMTDHTMKFPEDTIFLVLSRNPRDQKAYESDVVRVDMIDNEGTISWEPDSSG